MTKEKKYWRVLTITGDVNQREIMCSLLDEFSEGIQDFDDSNEIYIEPGNESNVESILSKYNLNYSWKNVEQEDWHLAWKDNFIPIEISDKIIIIPDWDENQYKHEIVVKIRPGMAFGTGHHETTQLMMEMLLKYAKPEMSFMDAGAGSGILSIAAYLLGVKNTTLVEFDIDCESNFYENLELNGLEGKLKINIADALKWKDYSQDLILANINKNVLKELIPKLSNGNGTVILSGLLDSDESEMIELCKLNRLDHVETLQKGEWISIVFKKENL
jgi:ribosomal protein L11 methyltransferase